MTRTHHDTWMALYQLGAPDKSIARICETYQTRVRKWRLANNLPTATGKIHRHQRWEDMHKVEIAEILEQR